AACKLLLEPLEDRTLPSAISLVPSEPAPQLVGERVTWTATATDVGANPVYQFSAAPHDGASRVVRDFSPINTFTWTPMREGTYVFVAGMLPNTTYEMRDVRSDGTGSAPQLFTTGALPSTLIFPTFTVSQPPGPGSAPDQDMVFHSLVFIGPDLSSNSHPIA